MSEFIEKLLNVLFSGGKTAESGEALGLLGKLGSGALKALGPITLLFFIGQGIYSMIHSSKEEAEQKKSANQATQREKNEIASEKFASSRSNFNPNTPIGRQAYNQINEKEDAYDKKHPTVGLGSVTFKA